jgi:hypothetical protein
VVRSTRRGGCLVRLDRTLMRWDKDHRSLVANPGPSFYQAV